MNELVTAAIEEGNIQILNDFPTDLMNEFEQELVLWIAEYARMYGTLPEIERIEKEYPLFVPLVSRDPIHDIFDVTLHHKKRQETMQMIATVTEGLRDEKYDPSLDVSLSSRILSVSQSGLIRYSTFDRSEYFKSRVPILFHFPVIDKVTGGLAHGDLAYIVGRLGTGKSTTTQWICHNWWRDGKRILFISNETLPIDILIRLDAMAGKFDPLDLRLTSKVTELKKKVSVVSHMAATSAGEIIFPRKKLIMPSQVIGAAMQLEVDLIIIDGVYLMRPERRFNSRWERVAEVSNELKQGALELGIPILGVSQIKRIGSKAKLDIEDIAYSDALGQDADIVLGIMAEEKKDKITLELIKNRFGTALIGTSIEIDWKTMTLR